MWDPFLFGEDLLVEEAHFHFRCVAFPQILKRYFFVHGFQLGFGTLVVHRFHVHARQVLGVGKVGFQELEPYNSHSCSELRDLKEPVLTHFATQATH